MIADIEPKKASRIFPFMEEINKRDYNDIYDENFIEHSDEDDSLDAVDQGFMIGYLEA